jgi:protein transport protein SEC23
MNEFDELKLASGARYQVFVSPSLKIKGALGPCNSKKNKAKSATLEAIGEGLTNEWYLGGMDPCVSITNLYEIDSKEQAAKKRQHAFFQFVTTYKHPSGNIFKRVTSITR